MKSVEQVNEKAAVASEEKPKVNRTFQGYNLELTQNESNFLDSKGPAFVDLWARRLKNGMKPMIRARFDEMVAEFVNSGGNTSSTSTNPTFDRVLPYDEN